MSSVASSPSDPSYPRPLLADRGVTPPQLGVMRPSLDFQQQFLRKKNYGAGSGGGRTGRSLGMLTSQLKNSGPATGPSKSVGFVVPQQRQQQTASSKMIAAAMARNNNVGAGPVRSQAALSNHSTRPNHGQSGAVVGNHTIPKHGASNNKSYALAGSMLNSRLAAGRLYAASPISPDSSTRVKNLVRDLHTTTSQRSVGGISSIAEQASFEQMQLPGSPGGQDFDLTTLDLSALRASPTTMAQKVNRRLEIDGRAGGNMTGKASRSNMLGGASSSSSSSRNNQHQVYKQSYKNASKNYKGGLNANGHTSEIDGEGDYHLANASTPLDQHQLSRSTPNATSAAMLNASSFMALSCRTPGGESSFNYSTTMKRARSRSTTPTHNFTASSRLQGLAHQSQQGHQAGLSASSSSHQAFSKITDYNYKSASSSTKNTFTRSRTRTTSRTRARSNGSNPGVGPPVVHRTVSRGMNQEAPFGHHQGKDSPSIVSVTEHQQGSPVDQQSREQMMMNSNNKASKNLLLSSSTSRSRARTSSHLNTEELRAIERELEELTAISLDGLSVEDDHHVDGDSPRFDEVEGNRRPFSSPELSPPSASLEVRKNIASRKAEAERKHKERMTSRSNSPSKIGGGRPLLPGAGFSQQINQQQAHRSVSPSRRRGSLSRSLSRENVSLSRTNSASRLNAMMGSGRRGASAISTIKAQQHPEAHHQQQVMLAMNNQEQSGNASKSSSNSAKSSAVLTTTTSVPASSKNSKTTSSSGATSTVRGRLHALSQEQHQSEVVEQENVNLTGDADERSIDDELGTDHDDQEHESCSPVQKDHQEDEQDEEDQSGDQNDNSNEDSNTSSREDSGGSLSPESKMRLLQSNNRKLDELNLEYQRKILELEKEKLHLQETAFLQEHQERIRGVEQEKLQQLAAPISSPSPTWAIRSPTLGALLQHPGGAGMEHTLGAHTGIVRENSRNHVEQEQQQGVLGLGGRSSSSTSSSPPAQSQEQLKVQLTAEKAEAPSPASRPAAPLLQDQSQDQEIVVAQLREQIERKDAEYEAIIASKLIENHQLEAEKQDLEEKCVELSRRIGAAETAAIVEDHGEQAGGTSMLASACLEDETKVEQHDASGVDVGARPASGNASSSLSSPSGGTTHKKSDPSSSTLVISSLEAELTSLQEKNASLEAEVERLRLQQKQSDQDHDRRIEELETALETQETALRNAADEIAELTRSVDVSRKEITQLERDNFRLEQHKKELEKGKGKLEAEKEDVIAASASNTSEIKSAMDEQRRQRVDLEIKNVELQAELSKLKSFKQHQQISSGTKEDGTDAIEDQENKTPDDAERRSASHPQHLPKPVLSFKELRRRELLLIKGEADLAARQRRFLTTSTPFSDSSSKNAATAVNLSILSSCSNIPDTPVLSDHPGCVWHRVPSEVDLLSRSQGAGGVLSRTR
ncbi:unnamed protein product [Amoebophrya sp. A25]|nr:unnamed protein product [Amoebophrya sp. A25]|eukprot:GSA25T00007117001.1